MKLAFRLQTLIFQVTDFVSLAGAPQFHSYCVSVFLCFCVSVRLRAGVCRCLIWRELRASQFHSFTAPDFGDTGGRPQSGQRRENKEKRAGDKGTKIQGTRGHRFEDVCYRVQLSLHLLLKAIVFCENCTKLHSFASRTSAASARRGLNNDGHSPSFQRHNSYTPFPRATRPSSIKRCNTARFSPLFGRIDKNFGLLSSSRPLPKNSTLLC